MVQDAQIDLVYSWVNGSDILHRKARQDLLATTKYITKEARFREHDELRYSLRSARSATASWPNSTWHIVTADMPDPDNTSTDQPRRLGLVPQWLDVTCAHYPGFEGQPPIHLQHDTQLFHLTGKPGAALKVQDASDWLNKIIPSFNSHAVESQLPHLDPDTVAENIVALNDDQFFLLPLPPSAFHSSLYGPVFRVDPNLLVSGDPEGRADGGGEWRSLGWSNHLLNERFGKRRRAYMQHNARSLSLPLLHEAALAFGSFFAATPLSQFRGSHSVPMEYEVNTIFLSTHYIIERHREALLWSWVVAKWGESAGILDTAQKKRMWRELGGGNNDTLRLGKASSANADDVEMNLLMAGIQPPRSFNETEQGDTGYTWVSMNGYSASFRDLPHETVIARGECIGNESEPAWNMFLRLLKENTDCGDNVIAALAHPAHSGLSVFLPPPSKYISSFNDAPITLPLELPAVAPPLPNDPRGFAVRLLMRYAYVLGDSPTSFIGITSPMGAARQLQEVSRERNLALLCINDDLPDGNQMLANKALHDWFASRWPSKLDCEM
ncbi:hypothetical protein C8J57DRAFT_1359794 [Mycena rebaudengoi]|nr:hypothetical protein C8J57DRAFT_1359794 [Mycena rebaudengoi]